MTGIRSSECQPGARSRAPALRLSMRWRSALISRDVLKPRESWPALSCHLGFLAFGRVGAMRHRYGFATRSALSSRTASPGPPLPARLAAAAMAAQA